ncbi:hypothetical protein B7P43_G07227 [Cryptotermes secundus]|uniref:Zinc finger PHD-type domain-containing protein n=1 Tax=Cryptotermes secundus TaxID=105785 RepID=A0A2J7QZ70_9NEOP|nr:hypothetical protein B7P43_G07227 [Cryptotermes secundus]
MVASRDACPLCDKPFYGKQKFIRCGVCEVRSHCACLQLGETEQATLIAEGESVYKCNACANSSGIDMDPTNSLRSPSNEGATICDSSNQEASPLISVSTQLEAIKHNGRSHTVRRQHEGAECLVLGDFTYSLSNVPSLMQQSITLIHTTRLVLSGVLRRRDVSRRRVGALNGRYEWITKVLGITFVDPNWGFGRDGLPINRSGARRLSQLYSRDCGFGSGQISKE